MPARPLASAWLGWLLLLPAAAAVPATPPVQSLRITLLSTMLADGQELGEWGFAALVEVDGHRLLFDTGAHSDVVLKNARSLGLDLTRVPEVVLSHHHSDHTGGFLTLRDAVRATAPDALATTHVSTGIFTPRRSAPPAVEENEMPRLRAAYEATGGRFVVHDAPVELHPGVWLTGPVPRAHPERNWSGNTRIQTAAGWAEDTLPEDCALVFDTPRGLVVLTGCGHAGVVNIVEYARSFVRPAPIHALIGGIHLFAADAPTWEWTAARLRAVGVENFLGAHCTGIETVYEFRRLLGLDRRHAVVGAVGATFTLDQGIDARAIAR